MSVLPLTPRDAVVFSCANRCLSPTYQPEFMMQGLVGEGRRNLFPGKGDPRFAEMFAGISVKFPKSADVVRWWVYSCHQPVGGSHPEGEFTATTAMCKRNTTFRGPNESSLFSNLPLIYLLPGATT